MIGSFSGARCLSLEYRRALTFSTSCPHVPLCSFAQSFYVIAPLNFGHNAFRICLDFVFSRQKQKFEEHKSNLSQPSWSANYISHCDRTLIEQQQFQRARLFVNTIANFEHFDTITCQYASPIPASTRRNTSNISINNQATDRKTLKSKNHTFTFPYLAQDKHSAIRHNLATANHPMIRTDCHIPHSHSVQKQKNPRREKVNPCNESIGGWYFTIYRFCFCPKLPTFLLYYVFCYANFSYN